jgi:hypothetical protein
VAGGRPDLTGGDVVDVPGDGDAVRDGRSGAKALDVGAHRGVRVEDGEGTQAVGVGPDALCVTAAELVVGERGGPALGVVHHRDLEQRPIRNRALDDLADEREVADDVVGDPATCVADDGRVAELEPEERGWVDARVKAGHDEQVELRHDRRVAVGT